MSYQGISPTAETEELLRRAEANHTARRSADAEQLVLARQWALAHRVPAGDYWREGPDHTRVLGASRLRIWEYAPAELALVWQTHPLNAQRLMADALDLANRMPVAWARTFEGRMPAWIARKLVHLTRDLTADLARRVDEELADDHDRLSLGRLLTAAEGRVAAADPDRLDARIAKARAQHDVYVSRPKDGTATVFAPCDAVDAARLRATCDAIADLLEAHNGDQEPETRGQLRARALGILADPQAAIDLLGGRDPRRGRAVVYAVVDRHGTHPVTARAG